MKRPTLFALLVIVTFVLWPAKLRASNLLFILDASGSMNGQIDGRAKMQIARRALSKLIGDLPSDSSVGLMTYGHRVSPRAQGACSDIQLLVPIAKDQVRAVTGLMSAIEPRGKNTDCGIACTGTSCVSRARRWKQQHRPHLRGEDVAQQN